MGLILCPLQLYTLSYSHLHTHIASCRALTVALWHAFLSRKTLQEGQTVQMKHDILNMRPE